MHFLTHFVPRFDEIPTCRLVKAPQCILPRPIWTVNIVVNKSLPIEKLRKHVVPFIFRLWKAEKWMFQVAHSGPGNTPGCLEKKFTSRNGLPDGKKRDAGIRFSTPAHLFLFCTVQYCPRAYLPLLSALPSESLSIKHEPETPQIFGTRPWHFLGWHSFLSPCRKWLYTLLMIVQLLSTSV